MRIRGSLVLCLLVLLPMSVRAATQAKNGPPPGIVITPGTYQTTWTVPRQLSNDEAMSFGASVWVDDEGSTPENLKGKPAFASEHPAYGRLLLSEEDLSGKSHSNMLLVFDESGGTGKGYDTLYLDVNRNRDLSDDPKVEGQKGKGDEEGQLRFTSAIARPMKDLLPGSQNPNDVEVDIVMYVGEGRPYYGRALIRGFWTGKADTNKGPITFRLLDANGNGKYGDQWSMMYASNPSMGDAVLFDWTGTGKFSDWGDEFTEQCFLSSGVALAGKLYTFKPSASGDALTIANYTGKTTKLAVKPVAMGKIKPKVDVALAVGKTGVYWLHNDGSGLVVPVGSYKLYMVQLSASDARKALWSLQYRPTKTVVSQSGATTIFPVGGNISMSIAPDNKTGKIKNSETLEVPLKFSLSSGGELSGIGTTKGTQNVDVLFKDSKGKTVSKGQATFG